MLHNTESKPMMIISVASKNEFLQVTQSKKLWFNIIIVKEEEEEKENRSSKYNQAHYKNIYLLYI